MNRSFPTKVDAWLAILLVFSMLVSLGVVVVAAIADHKLWIIPSGFILPLVLRLIAFPIRYTFQPNELVILSGFLKLLIPYDAIQSVEPTRSPISAPAFSLDRLKIKHDKGSVMVSPNDKPAFLSELKKRANLQSKGQRLIR